jgi:competence protein ComEC
LERPDILIADTGRLFGYRTEAGRVLSSATGNGFAAASWLENDGDVATQAEAHARGGLVRLRHRIEAEVPGLGPLVYVGTKDAGGADADCAASAVLIAPNWPVEPQGRCLFVGRERLRRDGALALRLTPEGVAVTGVLAGEHARPWTRGAGDPAPEAAAKLRAAQVPARGLLAN